MPQRQRLASSESYSLQERSQNGGKLAAYLLVISAATKQTNCRNTTGKKYLKICLRLGLHSNRILAICIVYWSTLGLPKKTKTLALVYLSNGCTERKVCQLWAGWIFLSINYTTTIYHIFCPTLHGKKQPYQPLLGMRNLCYWMSDVYFIFLPVSHVCFSLSCLLAPLVFSCEKEFFSSVYKSCNSHSSSSLFVFEGKKI